MLLLNRSFGFHLLAQARFLLLGNEGTSLEDAFLAKCQPTMHIEQFVAVGCLNVASYHAIGVHELQRGTPGLRAFDGGEYVGENP